MDTVLDRKHKDFEEVLNKCVLAIQWAGGNIDDVEAFKNSIESIQLNREGRIVLNVRQPEDD